MTKSEAAIDVPEQSAKAGLVVAPKHDKAKKGLAVFDLLLRIAAMVCALAGAAAMGTSDETLPFVSQFFQFSAEYDDFPTFQFFLIAMAIVAGYLLLSLPFSIVSIIRPYAVGPRILLLIMDTVALTFTTAAGAAAAAIVYLAHNGNSSTNWLAICNQFGDFCQTVSGSVIAAFAAVVLFVMMILLAGVALKRQ